MVINNSVKVCSLFSLIELYGFGGAEKKGSRIVLETKLMTRHLKCKQNEKKNTLNDEEAFANVSPHIYIQHRAVTKPCLQHMCFNYTFVLA